MDRSSAPYSMRSSFVQRSLLRWVCLGHRSELRISVTLPQIIAADITDWTVEFVFEAINTNISLIFDDTRALC